MKIHGCDVTGRFLIKRGYYTRYMSLFSDEKLLTPRLPPELQTHPLWSISMAFSWHLRAAFSFRNVLKRRTLI